MLSHRPVSIHPGPRHRGGFALIELVSAIAVLGILVSIAAPRVQQIKLQAEIARAIGDIRAIQTDVLSYEAAGHALPAGLVDVGRDQLLDPWGHPYAYLNFTIAKCSPKCVPPGARRDRFLVPINSEFDLYSVGPDGSSVAPLTSKASQDDIVRGNDGGFIGLARKF